MMGVLSRLKPSFDISSGGFRAAASDLGEVLAYLAGGVRPDPETLSRLILSLRVLQGFLMREAEEQQGRENIQADIDASNMFDGSGQPFVEVS